MILQARRAKILWDAENKTVAQLMKHDNFSKRSAERYYQELLSGESLLRKRGIVGNLSNFGPTCPTKS